MNTSQNSAHSYTEGSDIPDHSIIEYEVKFDGPVVFGWYPVPTGKIKNLKLFLQEGLVRRINQQPPHYAPLRPGNNSGEIVTDICTERDGAGNPHLDADREKAYYGGFLVAESIPSARLRDQIIEAYNDYYLPKISGVSKSTVNNIGNGQR